VAEQGAARVTYQLRQSYINHVHVRTATLQESKYGNVRTYGRGLERVQQRRPIHRQPTGWVGAEKQCHVHREATNWDGRRPVRREPTGLDGTAKTGCCSSTPHRLGVWRTAKQRKRPSIRPPIVETGSCSSGGVWRTTKWGPILYDD
jgi:hypothetical protein